MVSELFRDYERMVTSPGRPFAPAQARDQVAVTAGSQPASTVQAVDAEHADELVASTFTPTGFDEMEAPVLDDDGLLRFGGRWVALTPVQARVVALLLDRFGDTVTTYDELRSAAWGATARSPQALATLVKRLRRRIEPIGLDVLTVRLRGYVLDVRRPLPA
jgi:DNA-binding response OmpR family regulator